MIVRAPERAEKRPTRPRPQVDLACAEIILGDAGKYGTTGLMAMWAKIQKEKASNDRK